MVTVWILGWIISAIVGIALLAKHTLRHSDAAPMVALMMVFWPIVIALAAFIFGCELLFRFFARHFGTWEEEQ